MILILPSLRIFKLNTRLLPEWTSSFRTGKGEVAESPPMLKKCLIRGLLMLVRKLTRVFSACSKKTVSSSGTTRSSKFERFPPSIKLTKKYKKNIWTSSFKDASSPTSTVKLKTKSTWPFLSMRNNNRRNKSKKLRPK